MTRWCKLLAITLLVGFAAIASGQVGKTIPQLTDRAPAQGTDKIIIARGTLDGRLDLSEVMKLPVPSYTKAQLDALGAGTAGQPAWVTDDVRGIWRSNGTAQRKAVPYVVLSDFASLSDAVSAANASADYKTVLIDQDTTVSANLTTASTVGLLFTAGNVVTVNATITLTIDGPIASPSGVAIFAGAGTVTTTFDPLGIGVTNFFSGPFAGVANVPGAASAGTQNTAIGAQALRTNTSGYGNTAVGSNALRLLTSGFQNVGVGLNSLRTATTSQENVAVGMNAQQSVTTGNFNVSLGTNTLQALTTGTSNTALGHNASFSQVTGTSVVAIGTNAAYTNTVSETVAVGVDALRFNTTGLGNVAVGPFVLDANTTGAQNTAVGNVALSANVTGARNTAVGGQALTLSTGNENTAIGEQSLSTTTGAKNTGLGWAAGSALTTGSNNTLVGAGAAPSAAGVSNEVTIGDAGVATARVQVAWTILSDERDKEILGGLPGLEFVNGIRPFLHRWNKRDGSENPAGTFSGLSAQNLDELQARFGAEMGLVLRNNPDRLEATYERLIPVLVQAIQELSARVKMLEAQVGRP